MLCQSFLSLGLVDEIRLSIAPVLLGDGLRPFARSGTEKRWNLKDVVAYKTGFVELLYGSELSSRPAVAPTTLRSQSSTNAFNRSGVGYRARASPNPHRTTVNCRQYCHLRNRPYLLAN